MKRLHLQSDSLLTLTINKNDPNVEDFPM